MIKYIVLAFLLFGCGTEDDDDSEYFETVENCTVYEQWDGSTVEYCDIVISKPYPEGVGP